MTKASYKYVYTKTSADFSISEGIAPSTYFLPDDSLPTLWVHSPEDMRYEVVIPKGTILAIKADPDGGSLPVFMPCTASAKPVGVAQFHCFRPFDKGTSQAVGWIRRGYMKYPYIPDVLCPGDIDDGSSPVAVLNDSIKPGDYVMSDALGRFTKWVGYDADHSVGYPDWARVGQVIDIQKFGVAPSIGGYDTQLMEYMTWPLDRVSQDFKDKMNTLTEDRPFLATADYTAMFETGVDSHPFANMRGIDDALDRYGAQGMITIALTL
jgi:hypothetical protein